MIRPSRPNSFVTQDTGGATQLTYALQLNPAPLTVSVDGRDPVFGSLEFVITNGTGYPISVSEVDFTIQVGTDSSNLTPTTANVGTSVSDTTNWEIQSPGTVTSESATFTLTPVTGSSVTLAAGQSVLVLIDGFQTVSDPGNTTIKVKEITGTVAYTAYTNFLVTTFPAGFFFNGLSATVLNGSQLTPVAQVTSGATVTLVWNSSVMDVTSFTIYYSTSQGPQSATPTDTGEWTSPPLSSDTVFTVVVTASIGGGGPLSAALSTAVSVQNPSLIAASLTVNGATTVNGGLAANAITATGLTVNGAATVNEVTVAGATTIQGPLAANAITATGLTVNGAATIQGPLAANAITATGLAVSGNGSVSMFTGTQPLQVPYSNVDYTFTAPTDGFVTGTVWGWDPQSGLAYCRAVATGQTSDGTLMYATGGNYPVYNSEGKYTIVPLLNSFMMPVRQGTTFTVRISQDEANDAPAYFGFGWCPLGNASTPPVS